MGSPAPIYRGQGNQPFQSFKQDGQQKRGQTVPYDVNGAPAGGFLADGDYGDVEVLSGGSAMVISDDVLTPYARDIAGAADEGAARAVLGILRAMGTYIIDLPTATPADPLLELEVGPGGMVFNGDDNISSGVAATAPSALRIQKNGVANGAITFTGTAGVAAFSDSTYAEGDIFALYPPASVDATLDRCRITLGLA